MEGSLLLVVGASRAAGLLWGGFSGSCSAHVAGFSAGRCAKKWMPLDISGFTARQK